MGAAPETHAERLISHAERLINRADYVIAKAKRCADPRLRALLENSVTQRLALAEHYHRLAMLEYEEGLSLARLTRAERAAVSIHSGIQRFGSIASGAHTATEPGA